MDTGKVEQIDDLELRLMVLEQRNRELVVDLMRKSAKLSEAEETLKRWRTELEIVAEQKGHNLCWMWIPRLLKATLSHTGKYPDPETVTREEFELGCRAYQDDIFGPKVVIPEDIKNKGILTEEQAEKLKETLGFKK